jgi:hypothetical protein
MVENGQATLIREREDVRSLYAQERLLPAA